MTPVVSVEGNIGSGKSTLLSELSQRLSSDRHVIVYEPIDKWCAPVLPDNKSMLQCFYTDRSVNAMPFQMYAMLTRWQQLNALGDLGASPDKVIITERSIQSQRDIFGQELRRSKTMPDTHWFIYDEWYKQIAQTTPRTTAVIYVDTPTSTCVQRINARARYNGEDLIDNHLIHALHLEHISYVNQCEDQGIKVLRLDGTQSIYALASQTMAWLAKL